MTFGADMALVATELLTELGEAITIRRVSGGTFDPVLGTVTGTTTTNYSTVGSFKMINKDTLSGFGNVQNGDRFIAVDSSVTPLNTDKIVIDGNAWDIVEIMTSRANGSVISYTIQIRR